MHNQELRNLTLQRLFNRYFAEDTAFVEETINGRHQKGRIKLSGGVYWSALNCTDERILKGERVRLLGRQGNTWIVEWMEMPAMTRRHACASIQRYADPVQKPAPVDRAQLN